MVDIYKQNLKNIKSPSIFLGGEYNQVLKALDSVKLNVTYINLREYEDALKDFSYLSVYENLNLKEDIWCKRQYLPSIEFEKFLRKEKIEYYSLEDKEPIKNSDIAIFKIESVMDYTNLINVLELSNMRIFSETLKKDNKLVIAEIRGLEENNIELLSSFADIIVISKNISLSSTYSKLLEKYNEYLEKSDLNIQSYFNEIMDIPGIYISKVNTTLKENISTENDKRSNDQYILNNQLVSNFNVKDNAVLLDLDNIKLEDIKNDNFKIFENKIKKAKNDTGILKICFDGSKKEKVSAVKNKILDTIQKNNMILDVSCICFSEPDLDFLKYVDKNQTYIFDLKDNILKNIEDRIKITNNIKRLLDFEITKINMKIILNIEETSYLDIENITELILKIKKEYEIYHYDFDKFNLVIEFYEKDLSNVSYLNETGNIYDLSKLQKNEIKIKYLKEKLDNLNLIYYVDSEKRVKVKSVLLSSEKDMHKTVYMAYKNGAKYDNLMENFKAYAWEKILVKKDRI